MRWWWLTFTVATPLVVYAAVRVGLPVAHRMVFEVLSSPLGGIEVEPIDPGLVHWAALAVALGTTITVIVGLWGRRSTTEAWATGAEGERMTAALLDELGDAYVVRHDLGLPGSRANLDHLVVGPTGVLTVETKQYRAKVEIRQGEARAASGRRLAAVITDRPVVLPPDEVARLAARVRTSFRQR